MKAYTLAILLGVALGVALGWWAFHPKMILETKAPEVRRADGSLDLERDPTAIVKKTLTPVGTKIARQVTVTVKPTQEECPVQQVILTLGLSEDGGMRVNASSDTGTILGGVDVPISPFIQERRLRAVGGLIDPFHKTYGAFVDRDVGRFRFGAEVKQVKVGEESQMQVWGKIGVTF